MNRLSSFVFLLVTILAAPAQTRPAGNTFDQTRVDLFFQSIRVENNSLIIQLKANGPSFFWALDKNERRWTKEGQSLTVPFGSTLILDQRHAQIVISPLAGDLRTAGFKIEEKLAGGPSNQTTISKQGILLKPSKQEREAGSHRARLIEPDLEKAKRLSKEL